MNLQPLLLPALWTWLNLPAPEVCVPRPASPPRPIALPNAIPAHETIVRAGVVEPIYALPLLTTAHGWVKQVFFREGDYVRRRQILLKLMTSAEYSSQFNRHYVLTPRAGFVKQQTVAVGRHVKAGVPVATLLEVSQVKVVVAVPAPTAHALKLCDQVPVRIVELPSRRFVGVVERILRPSSGRATYLLTVTVRNQVAPLIRPRMHAQVQLPARRLPALVAKG